MFKKVGESNKKNTEEACMEIFGLTVNQVFGHDDIEILCREGWIEIDIFEGTISFYIDEMGE